VQTVLGGVRAYSKGSTLLLPHSELAIAHGQISAGVQAEHYRGKAVGLYEERLRLTSGPSDEELLKSIEETLGKDMAEEIGAALGYGGKQ
jgi:hypothetical protein